MPLDYLIRNRGMLVNRGYSDGDIDKWEFWRFQYVINDIIKMQEEKETSQTLEGLKM
ncbi:MAG: hypothetical protein RLZZ546_457 [Bacteroidota bacterium]